MASDCGLLCRLIGREERGCDAKGRADVLRRLAIARHRRSESAEARRSCVQSHGVAETGGLGLLTALVPFKKAAVISSEAHLKMIGVRIEDDYVITGGKLRRITTAPREIDEIEALRRKAVIQ